MIEMQLPEWITVAEATREFGLDGRTIPRWVERKWIQSFISRGKRINNRYVNTKEIASLVAEFTGIQDNEIALREAPKEYGISAEQLLKLVEAKRLKARKLHCQHSQPIWVLDRDNLESYCNGDDDRRKYNGHRGGLNRKEKPNVEK